MVELIGAINERCSHYLVIQAFVESSQAIVNRAFLQLVIQEDTKVIPMPTPSAEHLCKAVEVCAGLGCLGHGLDKSGFEVILRIDWSRPISELAQSIDGIPSCVANIADDSTLMKIVEVGESGTLAAGVSCQPYSRLGDQKQQHDTRAETLPQTLRIAHLTRKQIIILECVEGAMHCKWLQEILQQFVHETGFKIQQGLLHLQQVWPARRTRWWCVLTNPSLGRIQWQPFVAIHPLPSLKCLTDKFLTMSSQHMAQLELDTYELGKWGVQGLIKNEIQIDQQMATSLHSCANQLIACPCGCRTHPMNDNRLQRDGMHGLLVPLYETIKAHDVIYPKMRHIHPDELSLFNGVVSGKNWGTNLKLALCALGQLASPLQSGWIASHITTHLYSMDMIQIKPPSPVQLMQLMMRELLRARDEIFGVQTHPEAMKFQEAVEQMAKPDMSTMNPVGPEELEHSQMEQDFEKDREEYKNSQEPLDDLDLAILEAEKQPAMSKEEAFEVGAVPGFQVKRKVFESEQQGSKRKCQGPPSIQQGMMTSTPTYVALPSGENEVVKGGGPCPGDLWCPISRSADFSVDGGAQVDNTHDSPVLQDGYELIPSSPVSENQSGFEVIEVHVCRPDGVIQTLVTPKGTVVEQLLHAENQLQSNENENVITDAMGICLPLQSQLQHGGFVMISKGRECETTGKQPPRLQQEKRDILLWRQKGWVAPDEIDFYIQQVGQEQDIDSYQSLIAPEDPSWEIAVCRHILSMATKAATSSGKCVSAFLHQHHWTPLIVHVVEEDIRVQTTSAQSYHFQEWCKQEFPADFEFEPVEIESKFTADCGFQAVRWLETVAQGKTFVIGMDSTEASSLRGSFHRHIEQAGIAEQHVGKPLALGGVSKDEQALQQLLQDHGVNPKRSSECASHVLKILGNQVIHQILMSPRPWADLKARSSMQQPPIRLVLAEELQQMIKERTKQGGPVGRKNNKLKSQHQDGQTRFKLIADQVNVPTAVFVQSDGVELQQIMPKDLQPGCKGVVVANIEDSLPFFGLTSPISSEGVGLLILDFMDDRIPEPKAIIKVPVLCTRTNEPMLITAALVQLGAKEIQRNTPTTCPVVQEVATQVFRVLVFKDQYPQEWEEFIKAPVRQLMHQEPLCNLTQQIVDVWDRQFLSSKMNKVQPHEAYLFAVSIRVQQGASDAFAKSSGEEGKYVEPRTSTGRQPDPDYQVIWLPKKSFREATLAKQTAPVPCNLVRTADRYGLRASNDQAEELHKIHRPDQMFLQGTELKRFRVGPMPYGANKQSMANVLKTWQWSARPVGPFGQSRSREGILWIVQATEPPQSWVYQMAHGDVLITAEATDAPSNVVKPMPVLASSRTIQSLKQPNNKPEARMEDPWVQHDPWQKGPPTTAREASVHQMSAVQARLEAVVDQKIREHLPDTDMAAAHDGKSEEKVVALEHQIQSLAANFQSFQQQQASQNQMVQHQVQALDAKVDSQQSNIQQMLDSKLDDQMQRIEQLLSKRQRHQE